ncbi:hypothetical protein [Kaistella flava (ex Peng et al. 2021)]|nr:hypothetical protein [Kaistella flava (ex Peng et al. 2021)]
MKFTTNNFAQSIYFLSLFDQYRYQLFNSIFPIEMKGILKIYHPDETLKYHIQSTYCKAVYSNTQHFLEVEIITDDSLDHVDDDSLQYNFPQISINVFDFPIEDAELVGKTFEIKDEDADNYTGADLFDDKDVFLTDSKLVFKNDSSGELELFWEGNITDFYTGSDQPIPFKLKCNFKQDEIVVEED